MKALVSRSKGVVWRTVAFLPLSVLLLVLIYPMQWILKGTDAAARFILKEWIGLKDHLTVSPNALTSIAWLILYLPFIILSLVSLIFILYPIWYILKPITDKACNFNIDLLTYIQYREPKPEEMQLVNQAVDKLKEKLKSEGVSENQLKEMFKQSKEKV